jgi:hypothetical protein
MGRGRTGRDGEGVEAHWEKCNSLGGFMRS